MARALAALTLGWLVLLGTAMTPAVRSHAPLYSALVYAAAGRVCHQNPDRSFHVDDVKWPVCARCAGLYVSAPLGALFALRRRLGLTRRQAVAAIATFGAPTAITFVAEHLVGLPMENATRFVAALPLGAAIAWIIVAIASDPSDHRVH